MIVADQGSAADPALPKIAYLCCQGTASWSADRRHDSFEHDRSLEIFVPAFRAVGFALEEVVWNDPATNWPDYEGAIIGSVWDYAYTPAAFLQRIEHIASQVPLANPAKPVRWNADKSYLRDLAERGAPSIPTLWCERLADVDLDDAHQRLDSEKLVIKPMVGASGVDQHVATAGTAQSGRRVR